MKALSLFLSLTLSTSALADTWSCFLIDVPYKDSPVVTVNTDNSTVTITKNSGSYKPVFETKVTDKTDDVLALFVAKNIKLSFYMDESDALGLAEGHIKSPHMNGAIRCAFDKY